jgi:predicted metal-dependent hydrolase
VSARRPPSDAPPAEDIDYRIRRSQRARHPRVVVTHAGAVEVVLPGRMALRHAAPLVAEKRRWIDRTLRRLDEARAGVRTRLTDGGVVPYLGEELALRVHVETGRRRAHVARRGTAVEVRVGEPGKDALRTALERWYRRQARREIEPRLAAAAHRAGRRAGALSIRGQATRWASCSSSGAMSFNWRLLLAPAGVVDYVVEHEVAHLEVPDHSPRFWALVAERCPDYREQERWLRRYGTALRL